MRGDASLIQGPNGPVAERQRSLCRQIHENHER
jgi:hypothetical protein